jgi:hypothetical protein
MAESHRRHRDVVDDANIQGNAPSEPRPSAGAVGQPMTCELCGEQITRGQVVQGMAPPEGSRRIRRVHLSCFREHQLFDAAMTGPQR